MPSSIIYKSAGAGRFVARAPIRKLPEAGHTPIAATELPAKHVEPHVFNRFVPNQKVIDQIKARLRTRAVDRFSAGDDHGVPGAEMKRRGHTLFPLGKGVEGKIKRGGPKTVVPITLDFELSARPSEDEIGRIVKAIVAQDAELYPNSSAVPMSTGYKYSRNQLYKIGTAKITLGILCGWVRRARGLPIGDQSSLSDATIIVGWKLKHFGLKKKLESEFFPIKLDIEISKNLSESQIGEVIKAIVAQDAIFYPGGKADSMSTSPKYINRRYQIGNKKMTLGMLAGRVRLARGLKSEDIEVLSLLTIINGWKETFFGIREELTGFPIKLDFELSKNPTEEEIGKLVKTIAAQDFDFYPGGSAEPMVMSARARDRRYQVGAKEISLRVVTGWVRKARGLQVHDEKKLGDAAIISEWNEKLFGIQEESSALPIELGFELSKNPSEEEIGKLVKAIVAQDAVLYPNGDAAPMSTNAKYIAERRYRVGVKEITLSVVIGWVRKARGFGAKDHKSLGFAAIIREWKQNLFNIKTNIMNDQAFQAWVKQNNLGDIFDLFGDDPALLIEALSFLRPTALEGQNVLDIVKAYVGLKVERKGGKTKGPAEDDWDKRRRYILALIRTLESGQALDLSVAAFQRQRDLLVRISRKAFESNSIKLIDDLNAEAERFTADNFPALSAEALAFLERLHRDVADYFQAILDFKITGMRTAGYKYQQEGVHFLATHDLAILGDEAGLGKTYQAWAAIKTLGLKKVLWITTAANKESVREDGMRHAELAEGDVKIVISGDPQERKAQIADLGSELCVISNYETLAALQKNDPAGYARITEGVDAVIVDEAQMIDNPKTFRSKAIQGIQTKRKWLLTATPYQNKPESIWTLLNYLDPVRYPDRKAFKQMYTDSTSGLILLHHELANIMIRRTKQETMSYFAPLSEGRSFAEQLSDGVPRLPRKVRVAPNVSGKYQLLPEQADLIAWMTADYEGWVNHFNENLPSGAEPIDIDGINPLSKFEIIHRVIYQPEYFGITQENPLYQAMDRTVARRVARGEKSILWGWNTQVLDALQGRYAQLGVVRIDGKVVGKAREQARHQFQENLNTRELVANYISGGVGLTLTAASSAVLVQVPPTYPLLYQVEGRNQRLIGLNNVQHAKDHVEVEFMVPCFPDGFVEGIQDKKLREILSHGTLVEQTMARLEGGELLYNLVMEGFGKIEDVEQYFKSGILTGMGLTRVEKLDYVSHLSGEVRDYVEAIQALLPVWQMQHGNEEAEERVLELIEALRHNVPLAQQIGEAFKTSGSAASDDLAFILSLFDIRNKFIRQQILSHVPNLIVQVYAEGRTLADIAKDLKVDRLSPVAFVAQIYLRSGAGGKVVVDIVKELSGLKDSPARRYLEEHFLVGVFGILGNAQAQALLKTAEPLFAGVPILQKIQAIYRLGLLSRTRPDLVDELAQASEQSWESFSKNLERAIQQAIGEFAARTLEDVAAWLAREASRNGRIDQYLALLAGYQDHEDETLLNQYKEVLGHIIDGDLKAWRSGPNNREHGTSIDYLSDQPNFWDAYAQDDTTQLGEVSIRPEKIHATLVKDYISILQEWDQVGETVEGEWVSTQVKSFRVLKRDDERAAIYAGFKQELQQLGSLRSTGSGPEASMMAKAALQAKIDELRNVLAWMDLDEGFRSLNKNSVPDWNQLVRLMENKARLYRMRGHDKVAEHLEVVRDALAASKEGAAAFKKVSIEDTDDEAIISRMGTLHPEMTNCFNPNGNPTFNQYVVAALASKNMKLIVVRAQLKADGPQEIVAVAMMKVKRLADGVPVLFLERGLYRKGYDFRNEMLGHLAQKGVALENASGIKSVVMDEVRGKPKDGDPEVHGTGSFTGIEYVESVFGLRRSNNVKHRGRIPLVSKVREVTQVEAPKADSLYSIGTSNKSIEAYIAELKAGGVKVVVDVRGSPQSQWYPHFNRKAFTAALQAEGIDYVWLGETLGNPKDAHGERTLEGFRDAHMQSADYEKGMLILISIAQRTAGKVALTCSEGKEKDCHRKFILADLRRRLSLEIKSGL